MANLTHHPLQDNTQPHKLLALNPAMYKKLNLLISCYWNDVFYCAKCVFLGFSEKSSIWGHANLVLHKETQHKKATWFTHALTCFPIGQTLRKLYFIDSINNFSQCFDFPSLQRLSTPGSQVQTLKSEFNLPT